MMQNFTYYNPVKILFGAGQIAEVGKEIPQSQHILLTYGQGSIKSNGVYDQTMQALRGHRVTEFGGIEANPRYETLMKAVDLVQRDRIDFLLAVGGGSVLDGTKFIAAAARFTEGDPWRILSEKAEVKAALPLGSILTLPATGSEMNTFSVISRQSTNEKLAFGSPHVYPKFSILDPTTTFSLPPRQVANGIVDAFTHVVEQYMTYPANAPLQDRFAESILKTLIEEGPKSLQNPDDLISRSNLMWAATMALNGLIGVGVPQDWATHMIGHELTALHEIDHARTLALVVLSVWQVQRNKKRAKLLQYAERVWNVTSGSEDERIDLGMELTRKFFESLGVPTRLSAYQLTSDVAKTVAERLSARGVAGLGEHEDITPEIVKTILELSA